jgi:hypothetical protein
MLYTNTHLFVELHLPGGKPGSVPENQDKIHLIDPGMSGQNGRPILTIGIVQIMHHQGGSHPQAVPSLHPEKRMQIKLGLKKNKHGQCRTHQDQIQKKPAEYPGEKGRCQSYHWYSSDFLNR